MILALTTELKESIEFGEFPSTGYFCDLLSAALSAVDWREIAKHLIELVTF